jgi:hypothetical protein
MAMKKAGLKSALATLIIALLCIPAAAEVHLTLKKSFIEKYRNRVTISADFLVDHVKSSINPVKQDGDLHIAGRPVGEIGLMSVVEIQNARQAPNAVKLARDSAGKDSPIHVTGVWRVWFEHAGGTDQVQGEALEPAKNTNPDHVFEIHPATQIKDQDLLATLKPIEGYTAPDNADIRIHMVETMHSRMTVANDTVTIQTSGNNPNYIHFVMKLLPGDKGFQGADGTWTQPADGEFVFAKIYDTDEELLARKRRVAFVKGSEPYEKVQTLQPNQCLNLIGITRVNLELISWRIKHAEERPAVLTWTLPYELVAVGVSGDSFHCAEGEDE